MPPRNFGNRNPGIQCLGDDPPLLLRRPTAAASKILSNDKCASMNWCGRQEPNLHRGMGPLLGDFKCFQVSHKSLI